ncbi:hypothetical protein F5888DRAFT_1661404 [Russula emetica]|nr:hypothetical protein F5888DRAFT_1661404 [Russula emetica]
MDGNVELTSDLDDVSLAYVQIPHLEISTQVVHERIVQVSAGNYMIGTRREFICLLANANDSDGPRSGTLPDTVRSRITLCLDFESRRGLRWSPGRPPIRPRAQHAGNRSPASPPTAHHLYLSNKNQGYQAGVQIASSSVLCSQSLSSCIPANWQRLRHCETALNKTPFQLHSSPSSPTGTMLRGRVQSLPTVLPESFNTSDKILEIRSAYSMTLLLEHAASSNTDPKNRERKLIHARVLGHLLREAPSMHASENVANQVNSCQNDDQLDALGEMYFLHYICTFTIRRNDSTRSLPGSPLDCPSFKTKKELVEHMLCTNGESSQCSEEAKRRAFSRLLFGTCTELLQKVIDSGAETTPTDCVHIFTQSIPMISGIDDKDAKHECAASIWTIMTYFGFEDLPEKLVGNGVHTLENVMTLDTSFRFMFEVLVIWFEATVSELGIFTPRTQTRHEGILLSCRDNPITLTSQHLDLPLPNRTFLAIHAACCRIADLSGATDYIEKTLDDMEDIGVLAKGGSSTQIP